MAEESGRSKRDRKQVDFFTTNQQETAKRDFSVSVGTGTMLGDFAYFVKGLEKHHGDSDVVKQLHSLLFGFPGKKLEVKKHIRQFSGFPTLAEKDQKLAKIIENKKKWTTAMLKTQLDLFGLEKKGVREEMAARLVEYLACPSVTKDGDKTPSKKRASSSGGGSSTKKRKVSKTKTNGEPKKKRAANAYSLFLAAVRGETKAENPDASFGELARLVATKWKGLDEDERAVWVNKASELSGAVEEEPEQEEEEEDDEEEEEEEEEDDEEEKLGESKMEEEDEEADDSGDKNDEKSGDVEDLPEEEKVPFEEE